MWYEVTWVEHPTNNPSELSHHRCTYPRKKDAEREYTSLTLMQGWGPITCLHPNWRPIPAPTE